VAAVELTATLLISLCFSTEPSPCVIHKINPDYILVHMCNHKRRQGHYAQYIAEFKEKKVVFNITACQGEI